MKKVVIVFAAFLFAGGAEAKPLAQNYSGIYTCKGKNELVGDYETTATLKLKRVGNNGKLGTYEYSTETENSVTYQGQAIADGNRLAMTYKLTEGRNADFSTGIAEIVKTSQGRWSFHNLYYESDDTGGNYGSENCVMTTLPAKVTKKPAAK